MISATITKVTMSQATGFAMPASVRERAAYVRVLPTGVVVAATAGARIPVTGVQGTPVCGYSPITDAVAVLKGAFPGTSAWSPPI